MAKKKPKVERTFTTVLSLRRDFMGDEYDLLSAGGMTVLGSFCVSLMHRRFRGLAKWFPKPKTGCFSKKQRIEVTIRILPDQPETPQG